MNIDFETKLKDLSKKIDIELDDKKVKKYYDYMNLMLDWNEKINLTAITEMDDIILKHFVDSMTILNYLGDGKEIIDVGTGAGFPGIPISILKEESNVTLLDSLNKRVLFLNEVVKSLNLRNVRTIHARAEEFGQNKVNREMYDISVSRAVANLSTLLEYLLPLVKIGGKCICMKGAEIDEEIANAEYAIKELGGSLEKIDKILLPDTDMIRHIVVIKKVKETPRRYPRKAGTPSKNPLSKNK